MVAVKTGNFAIFKTILHAFNELFTSPVRDATLPCSHSNSSLLCLLLLLAEPAKYLRHVCSQPERFDRTYICLDAC